MKALFWLPSILVDIYKLSLPKWLFVILYKPASEGRRDAENDIRNTNRLASYKAKKLLGQ